MVEPLTSPVLLCVGDVSLDLTLVVDHVPEPDEKVHASRMVEAAGGLVANAAAAAARAGAAVRLVIQVGSDPASDLVVQRLGADGLQVEASRVTGNLCRVVILIEPHGEKRLVLDPGCSMYPASNIVSDLSLEGVGHLHTATYDDAARALIARCRHLGIGWSMDLEPASFPDGIEKLADVVDGAAVLFLNERAAARIGPDAEGRLLDMGARRIVSTLGPSGARYRDRERTVSCRPPSGLPVVDTTGAGDCLAGWFLAGLIGAIPVEDNLRRAVTAASLSCGAIGAQASYPDLASLQSHLKAAVAS